MTRQELESVRFLEAERLKLVGELAETRRVLKVTTGAMTGLPTSGKISSQVEGLMLKTAECEERIAYYAAASVLCKAALLEKIIGANLKPAAQAVLVQRYVNLRSFAEIAVQQKASLRQVFRLHSAGIAKIVT